MKFFTVAIMTIFTFLGLVSVSVSYAEESMPFPEFQKGCEQGDAESCYKLGYIYDKGEEIGRASCRERV